ncbi:MAG: thiamine phosphate synthase [Bacteroidales bacterium]
MKVIAISRPDFFIGEELVIKTLIDEGLDFIHIRKPNAKSRKVAELINKIPESYYPNIVLNGCFELLADYNVGGIHLNARNCETPETFTGKVSFSCHSIEELIMRGDEMDYCFLSPIYDSISKSGYSSGFSHHILSDAAARGIINEKVIALGGVTPERIPALKCYKFGGSAVLGYIWNSPTIDIICEKMQLLRKYSDR